VCLNKIDKDLSISDLDLPDLKASILDVA